MSDNTAVEVVPYRPSLVMDQTSAAELAEQVRTMTRAVLVAGVDYGAPWPGSDKAVLLKPGAERLAQWFGFATEPERGETVMDDRKGVRVGIYYRCRVLRRGELVASAERYAGRDEAKWAKAPWDTICAMAAKRALVAAVRAATATSGLFDEDAGAVDKREDWEPPSADHD